MEKERRKFKRFDAYMNVSYATHDPKEDTGACLSNDLSRDGIKLSTEKPLEMGTLVDMQISIPDDVNPVRTTGEVMWVKKTDEAGEVDYELGVKFLMMDPVDKFRVLDYAYNNWLETKIDDYSDPEDIEE